MSLRRRVLEHLRSRLADNPPRLRLIFPDGDRFDFGPEPAVIITFNSFAVLRALLRGNVERLAQAYVVGELSVNGRIEDVMETGIALAERVGRYRVVTRLGRLRGLVARRGSRREAAADISYHYDVSNDFYRLWLDINMIYSCAYFRTGSEDIDAAQQQKLDHICRKLQLKPGERLLDVGCGWGGLLRWAAQHYGVTGVGVTLSERQYAYARASMAADGLQEKIEIRLQDYRDLREEASFDKIVSVGMYEHVGISQLPAYFDALRSMLRPGGALLNDGIVTTDPEGQAQGPPGGEFIDRYVFPGGAVAHLSRTIVEIARVGLEPADVEDLRPHYALTLLHWVRRLEEHREEAIKTAGLQRYRIWRVYLAGMAHAFDRGWLSVAQVLAYKPVDTGLAARPWTRDYQYAAGAEPPLAGRLDWTRR
jgi:cyclopropane-fatty-acyl-phospholipid synthase